MLIIRLQRVGKRNEPSFRVVLTDSKNGPKSGKFLEVLGSYDARDKNVTKIDGEKVKEWISKGAKLSDTVHNLLVEQKIIEGKKVNVLPKKSPIVDEEALAKEKEEAEAKAAAETEAAKAAEAETEAENATADEASAEAEEVSADTTKEQAPKEEAPTSEEDTPKEA